jgi:hypothetical protein
MLIPEDSPLRQPPKEFSRRQVLILDGIRYAAEIADIAYERLAVKLQAIARSTTEPSTSDIAIAVADAWSIVDSAHRFYDLANEMPGIRRGVWFRLLEKRLKDVLELRNCVQHQAGEINDLINSGGQVWGYLSWAEIVNGRYTGGWFMICPGADYVGDQWFFVGPKDLPFVVPPGRIRLNAFGRQVYLGRTVGAIRHAVNAIATDITSGSVRPIGTPALDRRGADIVIESWIEVAILRANPAK